jgi:hypothetical protein
MAGFSSMLIISDCLQVVSGILALPKMYRNILFGWLKDYPSEYFCRVLQVPYFQSPRVGILTDGCVRA